MEYQDFASWTDALEDVTGCVVGDESAISFSLQGIGLKINSFTARQGCLSWSKFNCSHVTVLLWRTVCKTRSLSFPLLLQIFPPQSILPIFFFQICSPNYHIQEFPVQLRVSAGVVYRREPFCLLSGCSDSKTATSLVLLHFCIVILQTLKLIQISLNEQHRSIFFLPVPLQLAAFRDKFFFFNNWTFQNGKADISRLYLLMWKLICLKFVQMLKSTYSLQAENEALVCSCLLQNHVF